MPWGLKRYYGAGHLHFITCSWRVGRIWRRLQTCTILTRGVPYISRFSRFGAAPSEMALRPMLLAQTKPLRRA